MLYSLKDTQFLKHTYSNSKIVSETRIFKFKYMMFQLTRSVNFAISYARFKRALDANILAPEVFHMNPKKSDTQLFRAVCKYVSKSLINLLVFILSMNQLNFVRKISNLINELIRKINKIYYFMTDWKEKSKS